MGAKGACVQGVVYGMTVGTCPYHFWNDVILIAPTTFSQIGTGGTHHMPKEIYVPTTLCPHYFMSPLRYVPTTLCPRPVLSPPLCKPHLHLCVSIIMKVRNNSILLLSVAIHNERQPGPATCVILFFCNRAERERAQSYGRWSRF